MVNRVQKVGVIGAGAMGRGIAQVCASGGLVVKLYDSAPEAVARAVQAVHDDLTQAVAKAKISQAQADDSLRRIQPVSDLKQLSDCDLVVEAIVEQLEPKQSLFLELERIVAPGCILATNTSSLSVTAIASVCQHPGRVVGWHFFNPVPRMKLVEVIQTPRTAPEVVQELVAVSKKVGHRAVVTSDSPGFVVNHAGRAYVTEGLKLLSERTADHPVLDAILRTCAGFRMGPLELLDLTGLDVSVPVMESIHSQYYGDDRYRPVMLARTRLHAGLLGRKSGQGFYDYSAKLEAPTSALQQPVPSIDTTVWWPTQGTASLPDSIASLLPAKARRASTDEADVILVAPIGQDLSSTVAELGLDGGKVVAVDAVFGSAAGITLMVCPSTAAATIEAVKRLFAAQSVPSFVVSDSPGFVAPRVVACIVNLACEMAQQGIASPEDIDSAVRLALGYPVGPFEWGDRLGAKVVLEIMQGLYSTFGDQRYRPAPWLMRRARLGLSLSSPDRQV